MKTAVSREAAIPAYLCVRELPTPEAASEIMEEGAADPANQRGAIVPARYPNFPILTPAKRAQMLPARFQVPPLPARHTLMPPWRLSIRKGIDPSGQSLNPVMPRYELGQMADLKILIALFEQLSAQLSPG